MDFLIPALQGGAASLAAYLAAHVLLCLVPAFFIAGALSALVPQAVDHALPRPRCAALGGLSGGRRCRQPARRLLLHRAAAVRRHLQARARGWGRPSPSSSSRPAANILALSYTGVALGAEIAIARIVLALSFGIGIGMIMAMIFPQERGGAPG
jgi:uncharacterized membrane protein YraQ (UPF0718 family)